MSKHNEQLILEDELSLVFEACQQAIAQMGWRVLNRESNSIKFKEVMSQSTSFTNPCEIEVRLTESPQGTVVDVLGSNWGIGPIQSGHVEGQVGNFVNRLQVYLKQIQQQRKAPLSENFISELERLANLHKAGALTDTEFALAKQRLLNS